MNGRRLKILKRKRRVLQANFESKKEYLRRWYECSDEVTMAMQKMSWELDVMKNEISKLDKEIFDLEMTLLNSRIANQIENELERLRAK